MLAQEKVTKEKGTLATAVAGAAGDCASPLRRFADSTSMYSSKRARILRAPLRAISSTGLPRPRGDPEEQ